MDVDNSDGRPRNHCVPNADLEPKPGENCDTSFDFKACDGASDCPGGKTCCYEVSALIGACFTDPDGRQETYRCQPVYQGSITCRTAEVCSRSEPSCVRKGASCVMNATTGMGVCKVPPRGAPKCGAAPCPQGSVCLERRGKPRECVPEAASYPEDAWVVHCDRGSECAPDETCFRYAGQNRCDLSAMSWVGDDLSICVDDSDCVGFCARTGLVGTCYSDGERKSCECRPRCSRDAECRSKRSYCVPISFARRGGNPIPEMIAFCDTKAKVCDCREPGP